MKYRKSGRLCEVNFSVYEHDLTWYARS
jgi:hypothetical protein